MADLSQDRVVSNNQKLYNNLLKSGKVTKDEIGDFDTFNSLVSDSSNASKLHENLIKSKKFNETELGNHDEFLQNLDPPQIKPDPHRNPTGIPPITEQEQPLTYMQKELRNKFPENYQEEIPQPVQQQVKPLGKVDQLKVDYLKKTRGEEFANQEQAKMQAPEQTEQTGFAGKLAGTVGSSFMTGMNSLNSWVADAPGFIYDLAGAPFRAAGLNVPTSQDFKDTPLTNISSYYKDNAKAYEQKVQQANPSRGNGVIASFQNGDIEGGILNLAGGIAESAPASIAMMLSGGATAPTIISGAAVFGAGKAQEMDENSPEMDYDKRRIISALNGTIEGIFETYLGSGAVGKSLAGIIKNQGKEVAQEQAKRSLSTVFADMITKNPWLAPLGEGFEEIGTQLAQNLVDKYSGYRPDIEITEGVGDSFLSGVGMGGIHGAVIGLAKKAMEERNAQPITFATIEGQQFTVNNPEDLGVEGKPIFAKDAEGNVIPISGKKKDLITDVATQTQGEIDQANQVAADHQALMNGILDPNVQIINEENYEDEGIRIVDFSNGQSKIIYNGQEVIANDVNEKDAILNSINDFQKLPEPKVNESGEVVSPAPERKVITQKIGTTDIDIIEGEEFDEVVPSEKVPLEKAYAALEKKFKDNKKFKVVAEKVQVEEPGETKYDDPIKKTVIKSIKIVPAEVLERQKAEADLKAKEQKQADTDILLDVLDQFNATPESRENKQQAGEIEAIAKRLGYQTDRNAMNQIRLFDNSGTVSKQNVTKNENISKSEDEKVSKTEIQTNELLPVSNTESEISLQNNQLQNEESEKSSPKVDGQPVMLQGEDTPQAQQGEREQKGLEENVNKIKSLADQVSNLPFNARVDNLPKAMYDLYNTVFGTNFNNYNDLSEHSKYELPGLSMNNPKSFVEDIQQTGAYKIKTADQPRVETVKNPLLETAGSAIISTGQPATISQTADPVAEEIAQQEVNLNPTEAQKEAGNYKKAHVTIQGMDITIENPKGSVRKGKDEDGKAWENVLQSHYGYFKRTTGKDNDHIDTFIGSNPESQMIFVVDQNNPKTGKFDESKVMTGFNTIEEAKAAYLANYEPNWKGFGSITPVPVEQFKEWLNDGAKQTKPYSEYKDTPAPDINVATKKTTNKSNSITGKAKEVEVSESDIEGLALQYFINGGMVKSDEILRMFKDSSSERGFRMSYTSNENGQTVNQIAHNIWEALPENIQNGLSEMDVYNSVEKVIMEHISPISMAKAQLKRYSADPNQGYSEEWLNNQLKIEEEERLAEIEIWTNDLAQLEIIDQLPTENELIELFLPENTANGKQEIDQRGSIGEDRPIDSNRNDQIGQNVQGSESGVHGENEGEKAVKKQSTPLPEEKQSDKKPLDEVLKEGKEIVEEKNGDNNVMFRIATSEETFYSPTEKALNSIQQNKGSVEQFKAMLLKNGAKQAEMDWMGFDDSFPDGKQSVTKSDIQNWIDQNKIEVKEVVKGGTYKIRTGNYLVFDEDGNHIDTVATSDDAYDLSRDHDGYYEAELEDSKDSTKFSQYTEPGGQNYKELLLTLPQKFDRKRVTVSERQRWQMDIDKGLRRYQVFIDGKPVNNTTGVDEADAINNFIDGVGNVGLTEGDFEKRGEIFKSSHYDEPNILAHIRFNERTGENGERVLFVEEFQSDWAQKGKKEGFKTNDGKDLVSFREEMKQKYGDSWWTERTEEEKSKDDRLAKGVNGVPSMPFAKTDQWVNLAFRRIMKYAAENGFDRIAWTNGAMQADRYDLSKSVDEIYYSESGQLRAYKDGKNVLAEDNVDQNKLSDYVGKDIADKLVNSEKKSDVNGSPAVKLKGDDLKVGGSGMKAFYDAIIPSAANKLGKAFGARVEETTIGKIDLPAPKEGRGVRVVKEGIEPKMTVQSLPVTQSMKESVKGGVPLFRVSDEQNLNITENASTDLSNRPNVVKALTKISDELGEPVHIINSSEIPAQVGELKKQIISGNRVPAFFYNGKIYLLSDQVTSVSDALKSYLHELIVHKGLREVFAGADKASIIGKQYAKFNDLMVDVFGSMSRSQKIDIASKYVPNLYNQNGKIMRNPTMEEKALIGEEFLAHVSENQEIYDEPTLSRWQQFINRLWQIVRKAFRLTSNQFSQKDLTDIVRESRERLKNKANETTDVETRLRVTDEKKSDVSLGEKPMTIDELKADKNVFWHGSPSGDMRGSHYGLHIGTHEAAKQALEARIGVKADGSDWDGSEEYGKTLLAGKNTLAKPENKWKSTGYNAGSDVPENDYYPKDRVKKAEYSDRSVVSETSRPNIKPFKITGEMSNSPSSPHEDFKANGYMKAAITKGNAKRGYFYKNEGEDAGSISAVVPGLNHVEEIPVSKTKPNTILINGVSRSTLNSNGKPIANSEEGIRNFWKWFGESTTVNEKGQPIIFYHGTARDFSEFLKSKAKDTEGRRMKIGWGKDKFYFTDSGMSASVAASGAEMFGRGKNQSVMPVYLKMDNPINSDKYEQLVSDKITDGNDRDKSISLVDKQLKKEGIDGIESEIGGFAVFNPNQIKSATGNNGSFSPESNDIRFRVEQAVEDLNKINSLPKSNPSDLLKSVNETVEASMAEAHGIKATPLWERIKAKLIEIKESTQHFQHITEAEFPVVYDKLRQFEAIPDRVKKEAYERISEVIRPIAKNQQHFEAFERYIVLQDLVNDIENTELFANKELPWGYETVDEIKTDMRNVRTYVMRNPAVLKAVRDRQAMMKEVKQALVDNKLLKDNGNDKYFHHQVLAYMEGQVFPGVSSKDVRNHKKGWQRSRQGSIAAYNTNYLESEFEVLAQSLEQVAIKNILGELGAKINIMPELVKQSKNEGGSWRDYIPEGYKQWFPKQGTNAYKAASIAEKAVQNILNDPNSPDVAQFIAEVDGNMWVIPEPVAKQLDSMKDPEKEMIFPAALRMLTGKWKQWILLNPYSAIKYNFNNMSGDIDIVMAYNPAILKPKYAKTATTEAWNNLRGKGMSEDMKEALQYGIITSGLSIQEIPDVNQQTLFRAVTKGSGNIAQKLWGATGGKYWGSVTDLSQLRENVLRLAAYKFFKEQIEAGKKPLGASDRKAIDALYRADFNSKEVAAKLARELMGDYGNLSQAGQWFRSHSYPFWSWVEINTPRYYRLLKNTKFEDNTGTVGRVTGVVAAKTAINVGKLGVKAMLLMGLVVLWNRAMFPDEDDELSKQKDRKLKLIVGRRDDGSIMTVKVQGAFSDVLSFFGLEDVVSDVKSDKTAGKMAKEGGSAFVNKFAQGAMPLTKTLAEVATKKSLYPDVLNPRPIRDRAEQGLRIFKMDKIYNYLTHKPARAFGKEVTGLLVYDNSPGEAAYYTMRQNIFDFMKDNGEEFPSGEPTDRSNALYYYKQSLKFGDPEKAKFWFEKYKELGGTGKGYNASMKKGMIINTIPNDLKAAWIKSLDAEDKEILEMANKWYFETYLKVGIPKKGTE